MKAHFYFIILPLLLLGCQTTDEQSMVRPSEFPTIQVAEDLFITVRLLMDWDEAQLDSGYSLFGKTLVNTLAELQYPGRVIIRRIREETEGPVPQVTIPVASMGWDYSDGYACAFDAALSKNGQETPIGFFRGRVPDGLARITDRETEKANALSIKDAVTEFYDQFITYTDLDASGV